MLETVQAAIRSQPAIFRAARSLRFAVRSFREKEYALLPFIVDPSRIAVDVGANNGPYTHALLALGCQVVAVEANPDMADRLEKVYGHRARIVRAAASSQAGGTVRLRIPVGPDGESQGIATIEAENTLDGAGTKDVEVPLVTVDGLGLGPVGFIKVDVEGHELGVLQGARETLRRDRPAVLVEAEERHRAGAVDSIRDYLAGFGYEGFMLDGGRLTPIRNFSVGRDQACPPEHLAALNAGRYAGRYINNFVFLG